MHKSVFENSVLFRLTKNTLLHITGFTIEGISWVKKYLAFFHDTRMTGVLIITAILVNFLLICVMRLYTKPEWIFFRFLIIITFLPWVFCDKNLTEICKDSKILKPFRNKGE